MAQNARIKLTSTSLPKLGDVCKEILGIGKKTGVKVKGPTPLPVKRLNVLTKKRLILIVRKHFAHFVV